MSRVTCVWGLAAAHNHDIVHRDLKPGNIMVYPDNGAVGVKILDFGLAFVRNNDTKLT
ncbi:MAG: phosphotransferase [bacterium]